MSFTREIPSLRNLSLRVVGHPDCNPEYTFNTPSNHITRLLRTLKQQLTGVCVYHPKKNANDVDMNVPWIAVNLLLEDEGGRHVLVIESGNQAVGCLQSYIDALVDLGRMQDGKLGEHFFKQWKCAVSSLDCDYDCDNKGDSKSMNKRKREGSSLASAAGLPTGALSLHNCASIGVKTLNAMKQADIGSVLASLDLTGVHSLTDEMLEDLVKFCPRIRRLSIKNCRKVTGKGLMAIAKYLPELTAIDMGGSFNITPSDVIDMVRNHPGTSLGALTEIHASGLGWTDEMIDILMDLVGDHLTGLSIGFSPLITAKVGPIIGKAGKTLTSLGMHFCDCMTIDLSIQLGKLLPNLRVLDIRGANSINSITPMLDARASINGYTIAEDDEDHFPFIFVLARYTSITSSSLVDTRAVHSYDFECIIDGGGLGGGIRRQ